MNERKLPEWERKIEISEKASGYKNNGRAYKMGKKHL